MRRLHYMLKQAWRNVANNGLYTLASVGTITACLFLFGVFYCLAENISYMVQNAEANMSITVLFDEEAGLEDVRAIQKMIEGRPEVKTVRYISPEEAWESFKDEIFEGHEEYAETFKDDNPLADSESLEITTEKIEAQAGLIEYIKSIKGVRQVNSAEYTVRSLETFNSMISWVSGGIITILLLVSLFLISITVSTGISRKKNEIKVLRMLGASEMFIRGPYVCEGVMLGMLGAVMPLFILYLVYSEVMDYLVSKFAILSGLLSFVSGHDLFLVLVPVTLLIGTGIGFFGSVLTVKRYLSGV